MKKIKSNQMIDVLAVLKMQAKICEMTGADFDEWLKAEFDWEYSNSEFCWWALEAAEEIVDRIDEYTVEFNGQWNRLLVHFAITDIFENVEDTTLQNMLQVDLEEIKLLAQIHRLQQKCNELEANA